MEYMLQIHVFPLFRNELGYMRARVSVFSFSIMQPRCRVDHVIGFTTLV